MRKILAVIFSFLLILSCGGSKKAEEKKAEIKTKVRAEQFGMNILREDVLLLATKYEISEDRLTEILIDYEKMTQGFSMTEAYKTVGVKDKPKLSLREELVDVPTALNRLSEKYGISQKTLSTIIIEKKMMEARSKD